MSRRLSLNARMAPEAAASADIEVVLIRIDHPDLDAPIRLSTDPTERLSTDPLLYGTRSTWRGANPVIEPYHWVLASAVLPGDEDAPAQAQIVLENLDSTLSEEVLSVTGPARVSIAVVMADSPDLVEEEWLGLLGTAADITAAEVLISVGRDEIELEPFPAGRMSRRRFPGLHP